MASGEVRHAVTSVASEAWPGDRRAPPDGASQDAAASELPAPLLLYDGSCGLCAKSVRWILDHERDQEIVFAPLQGPTAVRARERYPRIPQQIDTIVYISDGRAHLRSKALLHAASHLRAPWRWAHALRWIPSFALDLGYRIVAAVRYRFWGRADACGLVTPAQRARFLS
jgi:predicted DCC family thiol-disulfide oxidoreductase YuxK